VRKTVVKVLKFAAIALAVLLMGAQFIRPARTNPADEPGRSIESHVNVTPEVAAILDRSCKDCHSNRTDWPWYSNVAPFSWFVIDHVNHARSHLNLSEWGKLDDAEAGEMLDEMCSETKSGQMPLESYTWIHRYAKLSPTDVQTLCDWAHAEEERIAARRSITRPVQ
jgi:hypothetical protein